MPSDLSREMLTPLWASMCQACDLPPATKQLSSPDEQGVEMEVFSEECLHLSTLSARKVMVPGYGQEEYVSPPQSLQNRIVEQQQNGQKHDCQGRVLNSV